MLAVAQVVANRIASGRGRESGYGWKGVILRPWQFSCFLEADPNFHKLFRPLAFAPAGVWKECLEVAQLALEDRLPDTVGTACWYLADSLKEEPGWAKRLKLFRRAGKHRFYIR